MRSVCQHTVAVCEKFSHLVLIQHSYRDVTNRADYYYSSHQLNCYWLLLLSEVLMIC